MTSLPAHSQRLDYLDSIRGVAAIAVVAFHYLSEYEPPFSISWLAATPLRAAWDGPAAVQLFFVLSGFVLALRYFRDGPVINVPSLHLGGFLAARFCRIWLPYAVVLAVSLAAWAMIALPASEVRPGSFAELWSRPQTPRSVLSQAYLLRMSYPTTLVIPLPRRPGPWLRNGLLMPPTGRRAAGGPRWRVARRGRNRRGVRWWAGADGDELHVRHLGCPPSSND